MNTLLEGLKTSIGKATGSVDEHRGAPSKPQSKWSQTGHIDLQAYLTELNPDEAVLAELEDFFWNVLQDYEVVDVSAEGTEEGVYVDTYFSDDSAISFLFSEEGGKLRLTAILDEDEKDIPIDQGLYADGELDLEDMDMLPVDAIRACVEKSINISGEYEAFRKAVRDGKVVKIAIKRRKKRMTSKQKSALTKARKKSHSPAAMRKRKLSMKIRKRKGI